MLYLMLHLSAVFSEGGVTIVEEYPTPALVVISSRVDWFQAQRKKQKPKTYDAVRIAVFKP